MPKIANDGLTRSGTGCFIAVPIMATVSVNGQRVNSFANGTFRVCYCLIVIVKLKKHFVVFIFLSLYFSFPFSEAYLTIVLIDTSQPVFPGRVLCLFVYRESAGLQDCLPDLATNGLNEYDCSRQVSATLCVVRYFADETRTQFMPPPPSLCAALIKRLSVCLFFCHVIYNRSTDTVVTAILGVISWC